MEHLLPHSIRGVSNLIDRWRSLLRRTTALSSQTIPAIKLKLNRVLVSDCDHQDDCCRVLRSLVQLQELGTFVSLSTQRKNLIPPSLSRRLVPMCWEVQTPPI